MGSHCLQFDQSWVSAHKKIGYAPNHHTSICQKAQQEAKGLYAELFSFVCVF